MNIKLPLNKLAHFSAFGLAIVFSSNSFAQFGPRNIITSSAQSLIAVQVADINNDGKQDVAAFSSSLMEMEYYENLGNGNFSLRKPLSAYNDNCHSLAVGDFDGDGLIDLATAGAASTQTVWFKNLGNDNFSTANYVSSLFPIDYETPYVISGDVDNDGDIDLVTVDNSLNKTAFIALNNGSGAFGVRNENWTAPYTYVSGTHQLGDLNGDSLPELIFINDNYTIFALVNQGNGFFTTGQNIYFQFNGNKPKSYEIADLDNDGDNDLAVFMDGDGMGWLENQGSMSFVFHQIAAVPLTNAKVHCMDVDNDGFMDILSARAPVYWYKNLGGGNFGPEQSIDSTLGLTTNIMLDADIDGDGFTELIINSNSQGTIAYYDIFSNSSYKLSGNVYYDANQNKERDSGEIALSSINISISPNREAYYGIDGNYEFTADTGYHTISYESLPNWGLTTDSSSYTLRLTSALPSYDSLDFGFYPTASVTSLSALLTGGYPRCNATVNYWINLANFGTTMPSGIIELQLSDSISFVSSAITPDSIVGNSIYWHYDTLGLFMEEMLGLQVKMPSVTALGDTLTSILVVHEIEGGTAVYTISDTLQQQISCSYDPNIKVVEPAGVDAEGYIPHNQDYLDYTVHFQNTGNDTAFYVKITDKLSANLDWGSFQLLASSHTLSSTKIATDGEITFVYDDIELPDSIVNEPASHGFVRYRVELNDGLTNGDKILNSASIYFDLNPAVITDTVINTIYECLTPAITLNSAEVCYGDTIYGTTTELGIAGSYMWEIDAFYSDNDSALVWPADSADSFSLKLSFNNQFCAEDSAVSITVHPEFMINESEQICQGDSIFIHGAYRHTASTYMATLQSVHGCDSTVATTLSVEPIFADNEILEICQGDSAFLQNAYRSLPGLYHDTLQSVFGCDSVIATNLVEHLEYYTNTDMNVCQGDSMMIYGKYEDQAGVYYDSLQTIYGCDSVFSITLALDPVYSTHDDVSVCDGDSVQVYGTFRDTPGMYFDTLQTFSGCDSTFSTLLGVNQVYNEFFAPKAICYGDSIMIFGTYRYSPGIYIDTLATAFGCDSIMTMELLVTEVDTSVMVTNNVLKAQGIANSYQWMDCSNWQPVSSAILNEFEPVENGTYAVELTLENCVDTSACFTLSTIGITESNFATPLQVYPNPTNRKITVDLGAEYNDISIQILGMDGRKMALYQFNGRQVINLDVSALANGVYYFNLQADDKTSVVRILKQE